MLPYVVHGVYVELFRCAYLSQKLCIFERAKNRVGSAVLKRLDITRGIDNEVVPQENVSFPVPVCACKFGLARRIQPSRHASVRSFATLRLNH